MDGVIDWPPEGKGGGGERGELRGGGRGDRRRRRSGVMEDGGPPSPERQSALQQLSGTLIWSGNYTHAHTHRNTHTGGCSPAVPAGGDAA